MVSEWGLSEWPGPVFRLLVKPVELVSEWGLSEWPGPVFCLPWRPISEVLAKPVKLALGWGLTEWLGPIFCLLVMPVASACRQMLLERSRPVFSAIETSCIGLSKASCIGFGVFETSTFREDQQGHYHRSQEAAFQNGPTCIPSTGDAFHISIRFDVDFWLRRPISEAISETIIVGHRRLLSGMAQTHILSAGDAFLHQHWVCCWFLSFVLVFLLCQSCWVGCLV